MTYIEINQVDPTRTDVFDEYINEESNDIDLSFIKFNENLSNKLFEGDILKENVRKILIRIFDYFMTSVDTDVIIESVTLTGSMVNYNYNNMSDIDIHIIINKDDYDSEQKYNQIYELLSTKAKVWNFEHENIKLFNHNIEIYVQESTETHRSTGVYDLITNKWIIKPEKEQKQVDKELLKNKLKSIIDKIEKILETNDINKLESFINKLKDYRSKGLEKSGEYAIENLIYKYIKHKGYMNKLMNLKKKLSI